MISYDKSNLRLICTLIFVECIAVMKGSKYLSARMVSNNNFVGDTFGSLVGKICNLQIFSIKQFKFQSEYSKFYNI